MSNFRFFLLIFVFLGLFPLFSYANDDRNDIIAERTEKRRVFFDAYDVELDGELEEEDVEELIADYFDNMDLDGDGFVSEREQKAELKLYRKLYADVFGITMDKTIRRYENRLKVVDDNEDDKISEDEYIAYFSDRYERMDDNEDGVIQLEEFRTITEKVTPR